MSISPLDLPAFVQPRPPATPPPRTRADGGHAARRPFRRVEHGGRASWTGVDHLAVETTTRGHGPVGSTVTRQSLHEWITAQTDRGWLLIDKNATSAVLVKHGHTQTVAICREH